MNTRTLVTAEDFSRYDAWVRSHPQGSLWQSLEWKRYQEAVGREVRIYVVEDSSQPSPQPSPFKGRGCSITASALVVVDRTTGGLSTWDIPRGPLCQLSGVSFQVSGVDAATKLLNTIAHDAQLDRCLTLFFSPDVCLKAENYNLKASPRHEQPEATRIIDLTKFEEEILAQMHPKGRYNIKVAQKNGVQVEQSTNMEAFYGLLRQTAGRDGFRILPLRAYKAFLERLPESFLLLAFARTPKMPSSQPIAGLLGVIWPPHERNHGEGLGLVGPKPGAIPHGERGARGGETGGCPPTIGIYYYGASDYTSRSLMAPYLLQWETMRLCKARGCTRYDLLGCVMVSPSNHDIGNTPCRPFDELRVTRHHPWAGVSAFKEKFGGTVVIYPAEQQIVLRPLLWKVLQWKRKFLV